MEIRTFQPGTESALSIPWKVIFTFFIAGLAGCVAYQPKPLDLQATLPNEVPHLTVDPATLPMTHLAPHRFNPEDGLDSTEVAILAVVNNPELKLSRDEAGIARAQAFTAGLLPDPQLGANLDFPTNSVPGSTATGTSFGLNYDLEALLTRPVAQSAAQAQVRKADLNLLWQEWQTASQARLLFVRNLEQDRLLQVLEPYRHLLAARYAHVQEALQEGNVTLGQADADLAALQDVERKINDLQREISKNRHELNQLLGLSPEVHLRLVGGVELPPLDTARVQDLLPEIARRRPDLLALQAGYRSQDLRYRQAIIEQFPALNVGLTRASDTSNVHTLGVGITLSLPLFNRNRGNIAIEKATRRHLYDEFETRLVKARATIEQILADQRLLEAQVDQVRTSLPGLQKAAEEAETAFAAVDINELTYVTLRGSLVNRRIELIKLEQSALEQRVGLQTLLGSELPVHREKTP